MNHFTQNGNNLGISYGGIILVMFTSNSCVHCETFMPIFKQLSQMPEIEFGICNVDGQNRALAKMSVNSTTPITAVPKIILYGNGQPFAEYKGDKTVSAVSKFLQQVVPKLKQMGQQQQMQQMPQYSQQPPQDLRSRQAFMGGGAPPMQQQQGPKQMMPPPPMGGNFTLNPTTNVKEYETSYGLPYNMTNEKEFLDWQNAYKPK